MFFAISAKSRINKKGHLSMSFLFIQERETAHEVQWTSALRGPERSVDIEPSRHGCVSNKQKRTSFDVLSVYSRARDGDRTRDPLLGKEVLHR